jgi:hypothetical protein
MKPVDEEKDPQTPADESTATPEIPAPAWPTERVAGWLVKRRSQRDRRRRRERRMRGRRFGRPRTR